MSADVQIGLWRKGIWDNARVWGSQDGPGCLTGQDQPLAGESERNMDNETFGNDSWKNSGTAGDAFCGDIIMKLIRMLAPDPESVLKDVKELKARYPKAPLEKLAEWFADRSRRLYTAYGVASALPSAIPGIGTAVQVGVETGTITADLALMVRHMARMTMGVAAIFGRNLKGFDVQEFLKLLGVWCGALAPVGEAVIRAGVKGAIYVIEKTLPREIALKVNGKIGAMVIAKVGAKRGGTSACRFIPFGVGAICGGAFNYATMTGFKRAAINYFRDPPELACYA